MKFSTQGNICLKIHNNVYILSVIITNLPVQCLLTSIAYCSRAFLFFLSFTLSPSSLFFLLFPFRSFFLSLPFLLVFPHFLIFLCSFLPSLLCSSSIPFNPSIIFHLSFPCSPSFLSANPFLSIFPFLARLPPSRSNSSSFPIHPIY